MVFHQVGNGEHAHNLLVLNHWQVTDIRFDHHGHGAAGQVLRLGHDQVVGHGFGKRHIPKQAVAPGHVAPQDVPLGKNAHRCPTVHNDERGCPVFSHLDNGILGGPLCRDSVNHPALLFHHILNTHACHAP